MVISELFFITLFGCKGFMAYRVVVQGDLGDHDSYAELGTQQKAGRGHRLGLEKGIHVNSLPPLWYNFPTTFACTNRMEKKIFDVMFY